jgi:RNA polymerase sigma factor (sigma-70 family)
MTHQGEWPTTAQTLLAQIRDVGDDVAWRQFVDLYGPMVYGYCCQHGLQDADALNVTQEVFCRLSQAIRNFRYDIGRGRFRNWLGVLTHRLIMRYQEKQARPGGGLGAGIGDEVADLSDKEADGAWIESFNAHIYHVALNKVQTEFDHQSWCAFERLWNGDERPSDVARDLGKPTQWVYQLKHRIVQRLKEEIEHLTADVALYNRT